jgi:hypothetical protein
MALPAKQHIAIYPFTIYWGIHDRFGMGAERNEPLHDFE